MDPAPWHALGRGTPAGRALYNLLCTDVLARRRGNSFSERNRALAGRARAPRPGGAPAGAAGWLGNVKAPPAHSSRPKAHRARVPRFPARPSAAPGATPPRGRRPASSILAAARSEDARARAAPPPPPGRVLGAAETARLALLMENRGALPAHAAHGPLGGCRPRARRRGMQEEALALLEQARHEVCERRERLAELARAAGGGAAAGAAGRATALAAEAARHDLAGRLAELRRAAALLAGCAAEGALPAGGGAVGALVAGCAEDVGAAGGAAAPQRTRTLAV